MRRAVIFYIVMVMLVVSAKAQENPISSESQGTAVITPFPVVLSLTRMAKDDRGTDVSNIFDLKVDFEGARYDGQLYTILYFIDGNFKERFKAQTLPFTLKRNYKGLIDGVHEIKIDVEDDEEANLLSTKTITIEVDHSQGAHE